MGKGISLACCISIFLKTIGGSVDASSSRSWNIESVQIALSFVLVCASLCFSLSPALYLSFSRSLLTSVFQLLYFATLVGFRFDHSRILFALYAMALG
jgi:hypothetical protein